MILLSTRSSLRNVAELLLVLSSDLLLMRHPDSAGVEVEVPGISASLGVCG